MSRYVSIRGWLECDYEDIEEIKNIINEYKIKKEWIVNDSDINKLELYQGAWKLPEKPVNWTAYIFYGADINSGYYEYIKEQVEEILKINKEIDGFFKCTDEEEVYSREWIIENSILNEVNLNTTVKK